MLELTTNLNSRSEGYPIRGQACSVITLLNEALSLSGEPKAARLILRDLID